MTNSRGKKVKQGTTETANEPVEQQRGIILSILCDFLEEDKIDDLGAWIDHVGFDLTALSHPTELADAWLGHYRKGRGYDVERALNDLLTWPPIAERTAFLDQREAKAAGRKLAKSRSRKSAG